MLKFYRALSVFTLLIVSCYNSSALSQSSMFQVNNTVSGGVITTPAYDHAVADPGWIFEPALPNDQGFSINRFDQFDIRNGEDFNLLTVSDTGVPDTIIIVADYISITGAVEAVGPARDLIFISTSDSGEIKCVECTFKNFNRVAFLTAQGNELSKLNTQNIDALGTVSSTVNGRVILHNVSASKSLFLDVLSRNVTNTGTIDLNYSVLSADAEEGVVPGRFAQGDIISNGTVDIKVGDIVWDFDANEIKAVRPVGTGVSLGGQITAAAVRVTASALTRLDTKIITSGDAIASRTYNGEIYLPTEGVFIFSALGEGKKLIVANRLETKGRIHLINTQSLELLNSAQIIANTLKIVAGDDVQLRGFYNLEEFELSAVNAVNETSIVAKQLIEFKLSGYLANRGQLLTLDPATMTPFSGSKIIVTAGGYVRNGMAHYSHQANNLNNPKPALSDCYVNCELSTNPLNDIQNIMNIGAYYRYADDDASQQDGDVTVNAIIISEKIDISTQLFENINPYYEVSSLLLDDNNAGCEEGFYDVSANDLNMSDECFEFELAKRDQVKIQATESLKIHASSAIINASAYLEALSSSSELQLQAPYIVNERYRVLNMLTYGVDGDMEFRGASGDIAYFWQDADATKMDSYLLSEQGRIHAYGDATINAGFFTNKLSDFAVLGTTKLDAKTSLLSVSVTDQLLVESHAYEFRGEECVKNIDMDGDDQSVVIYRPVYVQDPPYLQTVSNPNRCSYKNVCSNQNVCGYVTDFTGNTSYQCNYVNSCSNQYVCDGPMFISEWVTPPPRLVNTPFSYAVTSAQNSMVQCNKKDSGIVGYGNYLHATGQLDSLYVDPVLTADGQLDYIDKTENYALHGEGVTWLTGAEQNARLYLGGNVEGAETQVHIKNVYSLFDDNNSNALLSGNFLYQALDYKLGFNGDSVSESRDVTRIDSYAYNGKLSLPNNAEATPPLTAVTQHLNQDFTVDVTEKKTVTTVTRKETGELAPVMVGDILIFVPIAENEITVSESTITLGTYDVFDILIEFYNHIIESLQATIDNFLN